MGWRNSESNAGPVAERNESNWLGLAIPGMPDMSTACFVGSTAGWPWSRSHPFITSISGRWESAIRLATALILSFCEWVGTSAAMSSACWWWTIMLAMNAKSAVLGWLRWV